MCEMKKARLSISNKQFVTMLNETEKKEFERVCSAVVFVQIRQSKQSLKQQEVTKNMGYKYHTFRKQHVMLNAISVGTSRAKPHH